MRDSEASLEDRAIAAWAKRRLLPRPAAKALLAATPSLERHQEQLRNQSVPRVPTVKTPIGTEHGSSNAYTTTAGPDS